MKKLPSRLVRAPVRIACVHQGYELYGSDRCFIESVAAIRKTFPHGVIEVVLPRQGAIVALLQDNASRITIEPLWVLRRRSILWLATIGLFSLPVAVVRAIRRFLTNDLVYVNTSVIADHLIAARLFPGRSLLHVHELPQGSTLTVLRRLIRWSGADIIFNSRTTKASFPLPARMRDHVIYNGIGTADGVGPSSYDGTRKLRVLMLGRISRIKGQDILLDAIALLPAAFRDRVEIRIVGSAFEDSAREAALRSRVQGSVLSDIVSVEDFTPDTAPLYHWSDIVVVPSQLPESLGRVAIEAMAYGRPPVASNIGGLAEVVEDGRTGWLVPPGRADILAQTLQRIIADPDAWQSFAAAGRVRYEELFSAAAAADAIGAVFADKLAQRDCAPA